eukprot:2878619-Pyramimonas_sp.AAC.1
MSSPSLQCASDVDASQRVISEGTGLNAKGSASEASYPKVRGLFLAGGRRPEINVSARARHSLPIPSVHLHKEAAAWQT